MGKIKKVIFSLIAIFVILSLFVGCNGRQQQGDEFLVSVVILPRTSFHEMHYIRLSPEGVLTTSVVDLGTVWDSPVDGYDFYNADSYLPAVRETAYVELTQEQFQKIVDLVNQISDDDYMGRADADGPIWFVDVIHGDKVFSYFLRDMYASYSGWGPKPHMRELVQRVVIYSPIKFGPDGGGNPPPRWLIQE